MATVDTKPDPRFECGVCMEKYQDARLLQCGHHFCLGCLEVIAKDNPQRSIPCPSCRHQTDLSDGTPDQLPVYKTPVELRERISDYLEIQGQGGVIKHCDRCTDRKLVATCHCQRCRKFLCMGCEAKHQPLVKSANHSVTPMPGKTVKSFSHTGSRNYYRNILLFTANPCTSFDVILLRHKEIVILFIFSKRT